MRLRAAILVLAVGAASAAAEDAAPPTPVEEARSAIAAGVEYLLDTQNADGSWGYHAQRSPYAIWAPIPGAHRSFRAASTALVLMALRRDPRDGERIERARSRGIAWLAAHARVKRSQGSELYNVWAHGYGLQCLARYLRAPAVGMDGAAVRRAAAGLVKALALGQSLEGGWGYFDFNAHTRHPSGDSMSFTTATVLIALHEAREAGVSVPRPMIERGLRSLVRARTPEGTYGYSTSHRYWPQGLINRPGGSLTRKPACDLALHLFGRVATERDLVRSIGILVRKRRFARMALHRPVPHESWCMVSGYFYLYGYYYAAECWRRLPRDQVVAHRAALIGEVLRTRAPDGSFWDYPLYGYHKPYGTGYALLALYEFAEVGVAPR